ncbi:mechanosensitive ion channel domain-containing protein [Pseudohongiella sp. O18]|uniref:mechanosensitive ion channel domain-containing protein n=1 Tax=Pseudohongiella sp. O18 TaxID=2904248 RepID=UPI001EFFBB14|nr:mechanosensitive ion channel domain-containing protein [Pseudohongiella sp. O18]
MTHLTPAKIIAIIASFCILMVAGLANAQPALSTAAETATENDSGTDNSYAYLADILEDQQAREQLISDLRALAAGEDPTTDESSAEEEASGSPVQEIAGATRELAQNLVAESMEAFQSITDLVTGEQAVQVDNLTSDAMGLLLVIAAAVSLFLVLRLMARPVFTAIDRWALKDTGGSRMLHKSIAVGGAALLDLVVIPLAYVGGYLVALFVPGNSGEMDIQQSLFLNAFLIIEITRALIRVLFAARNDGLRMLPLSAEQAHYWHAWLSRLVGFIGYGILFLVPLANELLTPAVGKLTALIVMLLAFLYALAILLQNKSRITDKLTELSQNAEMTFNRVLLGMLSKSWFVVAIAYLAAMTLVTIARPEDALPFMLRASLQTLVAIGLGLFLSVVLGQLVGRGFQLSDETRARFPLLEDRLNGFLPAIMKGVRLVILIVVLGFVADAWSLFNLPAWLASDAGINTLGTAISVTLIILLALGVWIALASWIEQRLNPDSSRGGPSAREKTLLTIFRNAVSITLVVMTLMVVLSEIGINIGPLIAGAGVLGLAIGFGAQKLVQDIITGVFIQLENAINSGDVVTAAGITGVAEKLTIRSLGLRDLSGTYHLIPFSSVDTVSNYMREFAYHVGEYGVAYREDIDAVIVELRKAFEELMADDDCKNDILEEIEVNGVTALADSSVNIRVRIKTLPGSQWRIGRAYNRLVKYRLDAAGIEIPFPHMTLYFGEDKDGNAPAAPITIHSIGEQKIVSDNSEPKKVDDKRAETNAKKGKDFDDEDNQ